jgi:hypothetical protein
MKVAIREKALRTTDRSQIHIRAPAIVKDAKNAKAKPSPPWVRSPYPIDPAMLRPKMP